MYRHLGSDSGTKSCSYFNIFYTLFAFFASATCLFSQWVPYVSSIGWEGAFHSCALYDDGCSYDLKVRSDNSTYHNCKIRDWKYSFEDTSAFYEAEACQTYIDGAHAIFIATCVSMAFSILSIVVCMIASNSLLSQDMETLSIIVLPLCHLTLAIVTLSLDLHYFADLSVDDVECRMGHMLPPVYHFRATSIAMAPFFIIIAVGLTALSFHKDELFKHIGGWHLVGFILMYGYVLFYFVVSAMMVHRSVIVNARLISAYDPQNCPEMNSESDDVVLDD